MKTIPMQYQQILTTAAVAACSILAQGQTYTRASLSSQNEEANGHSLATAISQSDEARYVCWSSQASNMAPPDSSTNIDVFRRDRQLLITELVSVGVGGVPSDGNSTEPSVSNDGRFVAFTSSATNLAPVPSDNGPFADVFVRDMQLGSTQLASMHDFGAQFGFPSGQPAISGDGRFVAFSTKAPLLPTDTNGVEDIYVRDLLLQATLRASLSAGFAQSTHACFEPAISADGRVIAFHTSGAHQIAPTAISNGFTHIVVKDMLSGFAYSPTNDNSWIVGTGDSVSASLSADGSLVAFASAAENLRLNDAGVDCFLYDDAQGYPVSWISQALHPSQSSLDCAKPRLSSSGEFAAFTAGIDSFIRSLGQSATLALSGPSGTSTSPAVASTAQGFVGVFVSSNAMFVPQDTNLKDDVFVLSNPPCSGHQVYCLPKTNSLGCTPQICAWGRLSVSGPDNFDVRASEVLNNKTGVLIWGTAPSSTPFFGGTLCVQMPRRTSSLSSGGSASVGVDNCTGVYRRQFAQSEIASGGLAAGQTAYFQYWSRDPGFVPPQNIGLTAGIAVVVEP